MIGPMSDEFSPSPSRTRPRSGAATRRARRRPSTKLLTAKLAALSTAGALAIGGWLAVQMASGDDPALGSKANSAETKTVAAASTTTGSSESAAATESSAATDGSSQGQAGSLPSVTTRAS